MRKQLAWLRVSPTQLLFLGVIAVLLFFIASYIGRDLEYRAAVAELQRWEARLSVEQTRGARLQQELEWVQGDAYLEEAARRELGWVRRGDTLVVAVSVASTPVPPSTPAAAVSPPAPAQPPWQTWRDLFFAR
jgi:cell division protein FtsB